MKQLQTFMLGSALACIALGCEKTEDRSAAAVVPDTAASAAPAAEQSPTDREIAHTLQTSNAIILRQATLAKTRLQAGGARALADSLIAQHTAYNMRAQRTFLAINTVPLDNQHSERLVTRASEAKRVLEAKSSADFERAYVEDVVTVHRELIDMVDQVLLATTRDPFLKELLQEYRVMIGRHLDAARETSAE